jgi:broad specificity phosphatase PhoE
MNAPLNTRVYLIRHGQSTFGAEGRTAGKSDPDLSDLGVSQAKALGRALAHVPFDAICSSPMLRTTRTAAYIAEPRGIELEVLDGLRELDQGELEGVPLAEMAKLFPDVLARWRANPEEVRLPGGESLGDVKVRAYSALQDVLRRFRGGYLAIVGHSFVNGALLCTALDLPLISFRRFRHDTAGYSIIEFRGDEGYLIAGNITGHLET